MSQATTDPALAVRGLMKRFDQPAVDDLTLTIKAGEFYALLGPNGAGKTTPLRMVAGLLEPDAGAIEICGIDTRRDPVAAKRVLAWVPDEPMIYDKLTPMEYLAFVAGLWSMDAQVARAKADQLIDVFGLTAKANERCQGFSKGMRQKVALAGALIHAPRLIILDEPLTGLDAGSARQVKSVLRHLVSEGVTVIMTTHILEVAERMADRIGVIDKGKLVAEGTLEDLRSSSRERNASLEEIFLELVREDASSNAVSAAAARCDDQQYSNSFLVCAARGASRLARLDDAYVRRTQAQGYGRRDRHGGVRTWFARDCLCRAAISSSRSGRH